MGTLTPSPTSPWRGARRQARSARSPSLALHAPSPLARVADKPVVLVELQLHQFRFGQFHQVRRLELRGAVSYFVDTTVLAMNVAVVVTFARVTPVGNEDAAVGAVEERDATEPGVVGF